MPKLLFVTSDNDTLFQGTSAHLFNSILNGHSLPFVFYYNLFKSNQMLYIKMPMAGFKTVFSLLSESTDQDFGVIFKAST